MFGISFSSSPGKYSGKKSSVLEVTLSSGVIQKVTWKTSSRSRSLRLRADHHGFTVTSPVGTPQRVVLGFLAHQNNWIEVHSAKLKNRELGELWFRGKGYQVQIDLQGSTGQRVRIHSQICSITPVTPTAASAKKVLERWLVAQAGEIALPLLQDLAKQMGVEVPQLRFRETKSRWGSCSQHGAIMLNWRLIHAPDEVFRYVIIHELAHRVHMNHSAAFWRLVQQFDPSYPIHQGWLKRHAQLCRTPEISVSE